MGAYSNYPPASHPVRGADQLDQSFGWLSRAGTAVSNPRGGSWVQFGDHSAVGRRLFENVEFTTGDQGRSRGKRRPTYGKATY